MPLGAAIAIGIGAAATAGAGAYAAHKQSEASAAANAITSKANDEALKLQKEQLAQEKAQWDAQQAFQGQEWDAAEARKAPYRAAGNAALSRLGDQLGISFGQYATPTRPSAVPFGAAGAGLAGGAGGTPSPSTPSAFSAADFSALTNGQAPTPDSLVGLESTLGAKGVKVLRNAKGTAGKIQLPNGQIVDVIQGAGSGGQAWQWLTGDGGASAGASGRVPTTLSSLGIDPMRDITASPYSQSVPLRELMARQRGV